MRNIYNIAKVELRKIFSSPVAWILLVIFTVQTGAKFSGAVSNLLKFMALRLDMQGITYRLFQDAMTGVFPVVRTWLFLYIPLLTMGLVSSEKTSGTDKLLLSSPVRSKDMVLGKYLAVLVFVLVMFCPLFLQTAFACVTVKNIDAGAVFAGFVGLYLLAAAYAAIGLFMSSLTRYPIIAAVGTAAALFVLNFSTRVGQEIPVVRDVTYWLGISGRADNFIAGMISSEDTVYFLAISAMFLAFTAIRIDGDMRRRSFSRSFLRYGGVFAALCAVAFISSRPVLKKYADMTQMRYCTLTPASQEIMKKIKGPITVTTYDNLLSADMYTALPSNYKTDVARFERYVRFRPDMKMKYVYYYKDSPDYVLDSKRFRGLDEEGRAKAMAQAYHLKLKKFLTPSQIASMIDLSGENYDFVRIIEDGEGNTARLRLYDDMEKHPGEGEISAAMKRLVTPAPKVAMLSGNGERASGDMDDEGYFSFARSRTFRYALMNQGFDVYDYVYSGGEIADSVDILLVADPKAPYSSEEIAALRSYVDRGGNLMIAGRPSSREYLAPVLEAAGVAYMPGIVVQEGKGYAPDLIAGDITREALETSREYRNYRARKYHIAGSGVMAIDLSNARAKGFKTYDIVVTDTLASDTTRVWLETSAMASADEEPVFDGADMLLDKAPLVAGLERETAAGKQRITVLGNADYIANGELLSQHAGVSSANYAVVMESFRWLSDGEFPLDVSRPAGPDNGLKHLGRHDGPKIGWAFCCIIPLIIALMGLAILARRRSR